MAKNVTKRTPSIAEIEQAILANDHRLQEGVHHCLQHRDGGRWPEWEERVLQLVQRTPSLGGVCLRYVREVVRGRWQELEDPLLRNGYLLKDLVSYLKSGVVRSPCPKLEFRLLKHAHASSLAYVYARWVVAGPWDDGEKVLLEDASDDTRSLLVEDISGDYRIEKVCVTEYALHVRGNQWSDLEKKIEAGESTLCVAVDYTDKVFGKPWPLVEQRLLGSCPSSDSEFVLLKNALSHYITAFNQRIPHLRQVVLGGTCHPLVAVGFASATQKRRSTRFEKMLLATPYSDDMLAAVIYYAAKFIKSRWREAETVLRSSTKGLFEYADKVVKAKLPKDLHNEMVMKSFETPDDRWVKRYTQEYGAA